ncbi:hypothetical protein A2U01_0018575, partial [Trifolium medium]|nr:hypothetical protein [Trifolium medium]
YAFFENAVEARIKVKFSNIKSDFGLYGVIAARTSVIVDPAFSSILFFRDKDEKLQLEVGKDLDITLLRSIVGVPLGSKLILQFGLCTDDNEKIQVTLPIDVVNVQHKGTHDAAASCDKCSINVEIEWRCEREPKPDLMST